MLEKLRYINYGLVFAYTMMLNELFMPILPTIAKMYHISPSEVQWFLNVFLLGSFLGEMFIPLVFCFQNVKNQYQKLVYLLIMMLCISLSIHTIGYLLIARFITGFCSGSMVSLIRIGVEKKERNITHGYQYAASAKFGCYAICSILNPIISTFVVLHFGLKTLYACLIMIALMVNNYFTCLELNWTVVNWQYTDYVKKLKALCANQGILCQVALTGMLIAVVYNEVVFSAHYITGHYHQTMTFFACYASLVASANVWVRFYMPKWMHAIGNKTLYAWSEKGAIFGVGLLGCTCLIDSMPLYILSCVCLSVSHNCLFMLVYNQAFAQLAMRYPIVGVSFLGAMLCLFLFLSSVIFGWLLPFEKIGMITWIILSMLTAFYLLARFKLPQLDNRLPVNP
jgi:predicted MFS family arabinose efflux permease